eukprot:238621_1
MDKNRKHNKIKSKDWVSCIMHMCDTRRFTVMEKWGTVLDLNLVIEEEFPDSESEAENEDNICSNNLESESVDDNDVAIFINSSLNLGNFVSFKGLLGAISK